MGGQKSWYRSRKEPLYWKKGQIKTQNIWRQGKKQRSKLTGLEDNFSNFLFDRAKRLIFNDLQCFIHQKTAACSNKRCVRHHNLNPSIQVELNSVFKQENWLASTHSKNGRAYILYAMEKPMERNIYSPDLRCRTT